jgi:predicted aspartyl protease
VLTTSTAQAIGLVVPDGAESEAIQAAPNREVTAKRITIGYLRLGRCVLRGVRAYVLPPEAEDLGNRLGRSALAGHRVRLEPQRLRMWIDDEG